MAVSKKGMLADLFDGTFRTLSRTWLTTLVIGGVLFIPAAVLSGWSYGRFFSALAGITEAEDPIAQLLPLGLSYLWIMLGALAQGFALLFVRACVTEATARAARGEKPDPLAIAGHIFTHFYGRLIGQRALQYVILGAMFVGATALGAAAIAVGAATGLDLVGALVGGVLILAGMALGYFFAIRWSVTLESVVLEDRRIGSSLGRSAELVRGAWWRIFGFTLLVGMMVSFGVSLVSTPVVFFATIRKYIEFVGSLVQNVNSTEDMMSMMRSLFSGMAPSLAILTYVQGLLSAFVVPVFMTLLFLELRRRTDAPDPAAISAATGSPEPPTSGAGAAPGAPAWAPGYPPAT